MNKFILYLLIYSIILVLPGQSGLSNSNNTWNQLTIADYQNTSRVTLPPQDNPDQQSDNTCYGLFLANIFPYTGQQSQRVMGVFKELPAEQQQQSLEYFKNIARDCVSFNLSHPFETLFWIKHKVTPRVSLEKQHADLFIYLLDSKNIESLISKAFTLGSTLLPIERKALTFLIEQNFYHNVGWKSVTLIGLLFKVIPISKWFRVFDSEPTSPFTQMFIRGHMPLRAIFGASSIKIKTFTRLSKQLNRLPNQSTIRSSIETQIEQLEAIPGSNYHREQVLLNLHLLRTSLETNEHQQQKQINDLKCIISGQCGSYLKALLFEAFPRLLQFPIRLNDKIMMWMWTLSVASVIAVSIVEFVWPEVVPIDIFYQKDLTSTTFHNTESDPNLDLGSNSNSSSNLGSRDSKALIGVEDQLRDMINQTN